jgi:hypothetical protein
MLLLKNSRESSRKGYSTERAQLGRYLLEGGLDSEKLIRTRLRKQHKSRSGAKQRRTSKGGVFMIHPTSGCWGPLDLTWKKP